MFRIRKIYDRHSPANRKALDQALAILRSHFTAVKPEKINELNSRIDNPLKYKFQTMLFVAEDDKGNVTGFAILLAAPGP